jgi:hypothetical protein
VSNRTNKDEKSNDAVKLQRKIYRNKQQEIAQETRGLGLCTSIATRASTDTPYR